MLRNCYCAHHYITTKSVKKSCIFWTLLTSMLRNVTQLLWTLQSRMLGNAVFMYMYITRQLPRMTSIIISNILCTLQSPLDGVHNLRVMLGNGLRKDIWAQFQNRFKVPQIMEFYGATEGPIVLFNVNNKVGAAGRLSPVGVSD